MPSEYTKGKRIVVIQTKAKPISMSLLGQTLFSGHLMRGEV